MFTIFFHKGGEMMYFQIDPKKNIPIYEQIIQQVKEMCARGILKKNEKLPSVRELSSQMIINPNTVSKAYQELERLGVIVTIRGKGTFVSDELQLTKDPATMNELKNSLRQLIIDSYYAGVSEKEFKEWLMEIYDEIGGQQNESKTDLKEN